MKTAVLVVLAVVAGLQGWVRLAPTDPARWHVDLVAARPPGVPLPAREVTALEGGALVDLASPDPAATLARLDEIARATPRTRLIAGSAAEGRMTWETRSALWGFPDYTTAQATAEGVTLYARLRFGRSDLGVNAARLTTWIGQL